MAVRGSAVSAALHRLCWAVLAVLAVLAGIGILAMHGSKDQPGDCEGLAQGTTTPWKMPLLGPLELALVAARRTTGSTTRCDRCILQVKKNIRRRELGSITPAGRVG